MKVLLVESPFSYGTAKSIVGDYFPLGIGYIASYTRSKGYDVDIFQPDTKSNYIESLVEKLSQFLPDVVGISVMTPSFPNSIKLCSVIKNYNLNIQTVLGGHHISAVQEQVLDVADVIDFAVIGEGEETFVELLNALKNKTNDLSYINGLIWRDNKQIKKNSSRHFITNIDNLLPPARDLVNMDLFKLHSYIDFGKKSATMITSRGCPFKCAFCSSWLTMGSKYRFRSAENVINEIKILVNDFGIDHIVFEDDTMTLNRSRMLKICKELAVMKNRPSWYCLSRVDTIDEELVLAMKNSGCRMISFGIESGDPKILKQIGKKIELHKAIEAVKTCRKIGIRTLCTFIVGFPKDTKLTMHKTYKIAKQIGPTIAIFFPLTPYPGTEIYEKYLSKKFKPKDINEWEKFIVTADSTPISCNKDFSGQMINTIAHKWNKKYYLRPIQWFRILKTINSIEEFYRVMKAGLYILKN